MSHFNLIVIGAGIVGACVAYQARRRFPQWNILLVDRSFVADGVTRYSGGLNHPYGWSELQKELSLESLRLFDELRAVIPRLALFDAPLFGLASEGRVESILSRFTRPGARRGTQRDLTGLRGTYPDLLVPEGQVLLTGCDGGFGDPPAITRSIVGWLRGQARTTCWEGLEITDVKSGADHHAVVTSDGRSFVGDRVVLAAGPWMVHGLGREVLAGVGVRIKKIVALHVERTPARGDPLLFFFDDDSYLLPHHEQQYWLFSFPCREWDCSPDVSRLRITSDDRAHALAILGRYCPSMKMLCHTGRVFCDAYSSDRMPVISSVHGSPRLVLAGACSGFGFRLAPAIARRAIDAVTLDAGA